MEISEIKTRLTLSQILHHYHLKPDKNLRLNCPFHDDKTPSLQVYYKTHTAYCFSTNCKTHGKSLDVIDFIMHMEDCTKHEAIQKAKAHIEGSTEPLSMLPTKTGNGLARSAVLLRMFTYFKNGVHNSKPAKSYLQKRCLDYTKTEVGYNSGQFHHGNRRDQDLIKSCVKYGLLLDLGTKARTGNVAYKPFGKWGIVFPLRDNKNQIVSLYFRSIRDNSNQRHYYLRDRQGLYPGYPGQSSEKLILTESIIDAASLLQQPAINSQYSMLALYGTNGWTKEHDKAVSRLKKLEELIFFLNGDDPGREAMTKYSEALKNEYPGLKISHVQVPEGEDVNSLIQGHSVDILTHLINERNEHELLFSSEPAPQGNESSTKSNENSAKAKSPDQAQTQSGNLQSEINNQQSRLDTNNPYNLKYTTPTAKYQIKGFRITQPDSLKITLNITKR